MIVKRKPFTIELCIINVMSLMNICANMRDHGIEIVNTISRVDAFTDTFGSVGCHVKCHWELDVFVYFRLTAVKTLTSEEDRFLGTLSCRQSTLGRILIDICFVAPVEREQFEQVHCDRSKGSAAVYLPSIPGPTESAESS